MLAEMLLLLTSVTMPTSEQVASREHDVLRHDKSMYQSQPQAWWHGTWIEKMDEERRLRLHSTALLLPSWSKVKAPVLYTVGFFKFGKYFILGLNMVPLAFLLKWLSCRWSSLVPFVGIWAKAPQCAPGFFSNSLQVCWLKKLETS